MKTAKFLALVMLIAALSLMMLGQASAQVIFFADFEVDSKDAVPDKGVNEVNKYKGPPGTIWTLADFKGKGGGKKALKQTAEGCGTSGDTPLPGVTNFTDGIVQVIMSWGDDDSFGVTFRKKGANGYLVSFGYNETPKVIIADFADGCCPDGQCLDQCGCENGGKEKVGVDHGFGGGLDQTNQTAYFGRVEVLGSSIKVWYKLLSDVKDPFGDSKGLGNPIAEYNKADFKGPGTVGIWHESWGMGEVDSIFVVGAGGFAVDARGKLATSWGYVKSGY
jgi:hypothetical protein